MLSGHLVRVNPVRFITHLEPMHIISAPRCQREKIGREKKKNKIKLETGYMPFFVFLLNRAKLTSKGADLSAISGKQAAYSYL